MGGLARNLEDAFLTVRDETERRASPLSPEDQQIQSMPDASPTKWHRAHTTWFWEQFLLGEHCASYRPFHPDFAFLFNSYYVSAGPRHSRNHRGDITRPSADQVGAYRKYVDAAVVKFFREAGEDKLREIAPLVEVGLNHEQQHQELMFTDILHAFAQNPIPPAYDPDWRFPTATPAGEDWLTLNEGIHTIGHVDDSFHFDNEKPAHRALVGPVKVARNLVTNGEWLAFMRAGGYRTATLWLMDGFAAVNNEGWDAPGHWREIDGQWHVMTLAGLKPVDPTAPVCHVSYYEADAFARWAGKHLPTEMEWEVAARASQLNDAFGIVWQWTRSSYSHPTPGIALSKARSASTTASSWSTSWCCAAPRLQPRRGTAVSPIATSSIRTTAGSSRDCGSPTTNNNYPTTTARRTARSGEYHECARQRFG
ncbi:ergothioneine biosynthesis protein EgtB [Bradyrhizobium sp. LB7.2]